MKVKKVRGVKEGADRVSYLHVEYFLQEGEDGDDVVPLRVPSWVEGADVQLASLREGGREGGKDR